MPTADRSPRLRDHDLARRRRSGSGSAAGARIVGTIYDPQHAGIPGATVAVTNIATNVARSVTSDVAGNYVVTPLDPGTYNVTASIAGKSRTTVREGVELTVGQAARVELTLALSTLSTEVFVTTQASLLNTESATIAENGKRADVSGWILIAEVPQSGP